MLWNTIYEFFVKYIFGGYLEGNTYYATYLSRANGDLNGVYLQFDIFGVTDVSLPNYLSLIATIISMVAIVLICCALIKKIYNMCAHIIG